MNFHAFLDASIAVQIHAAAGILGFLLGSYILARRKGGLTHRRLGRIWVGVMVLVAFSALFIYQIRMWGPFSPLHILSLVTFGSCWWIVRTARRRSMLAHKQTVVGLYLGGTVVAGGITFMPGLLMHRIFLEGSTDDLSRLADMPVDPLVLAFGLAAAAFFATFLFRERGKTR